MGGSLRSHNARRFLILLLSALGAIAGTLAPTPSAAAQPLQGDLSVAFVSPPATGTRGGPLLLRFVVANRGIGPQPLRVRATNVRAILRVPSGTTAVTVTSFDFFSSCDFVTGIQPDYVDCRGANLDPGQQATVVVTLTAPPGAGGVTFELSAQVRPGFPDVNSSNNRATHTVLLSAAPSPGLPNLQVFATPLEQPPYRIGQAVNHQVTSRNVGTGSAVWPAGSNVLVRVTDLISSATSNITIQSPPFSLLAPGGQAPTGRPVRLSHTLHCFLFQIDPAGLVAESDENDDRWFQCFIAS